MSTVKSWLGSAIFGESIRPYVGLVLVFALRQICQMLCPLPAPSGMVWRYPGVPAVLVTYGTANDLFFVRNHGGVPTVDRAAYRLERGARLVQIRAGAESVRAGGPIRRHVIGANAADREYQRTPRQHRTPRFEHRRRQLLGRKHLQAVSAGRERGSR